MIKNLKRFIYAVGFYKVGTLFGVPLYHLYHYYSGEQIDFKQEFGNNSWAVITGATDGIGKALAFDLAKKGMNIALLSRNQEKLDSVAEEIRREANVEVMTQQIDFGKADLNKYRQVQSQLQSKNIGILVNNVGTGTKFVPNLERDPEQYQQYIRVNIIPQVLLTKYYLTQVKNDDREIEFKKLTIHISSLAGDRLRMRSIYPATKCFNKIFARSFFNDSDVKHLIIKPAHVSTAMNRYIKINWYTCNAADEADAITRSVGYIRETYGHPKHVFYYGFLMGFFPKPLYQAMLTEKLPQLKRFI